MRFIKEIKPSLHGISRLFNTLSSLVGINLLIAGISFVTTMMIANVLGRKSFGDYSFAIAVGSYSLMFVQYGLEKSFVRELVHFPDRFGELFKASILLKLFLFLLFCLCFVIVVQIFREIPGFSWGVVFVVVATTLSAFHLNGVYDAWQQMPRHATYYMIEKSLFCVLVWTILLTSFLKLSIELIGLSLLLASVIGLVLQYQWALPRIDFKCVKGTRASTLFIIRSNFFIWLAVLSGLSIDYMSQIILKLYSGSAELGSYSVAWKVTQLGTLFLAQAGRIGAEATARHTRPDRTAKEGRQFLIKYIVFMVTMGFIVGLPSLLFPQYILKLFTTEYSNAKETLRLFGIYPLLFGPYLAILQYVISMRMQKTYFTLITTVGIISIALSLWLIPQLQSIGAVISVLVSLAIALFLFIGVVWFDLIYRKIT